MPLLKGDSGSSFHTGAWAVAAVRVLTRTLSKIAHPILICDVRDAKTDPFPGDMGLLWWVTVHQRFPFIFLNLLQMALGLPELFFRLYPTSSLSFAGSDPNHVRWHTQLTWLLPHFLSWASPPNKSRECNSLLLPNPRKRVSLSEKQGVETAQPRPAWPRA